MVSKFTGVLLASLVMVGGCKDKEAKKAEPAPKKVEEVATDTPAEEAAERGTVQLSVLIKDDEAWIGCAESEASEACPAAQKIVNCGDKIDSAAISEGLCKMAQTLGEDRNVEIQIGAADEVSYQRVVNTMDALTATNFRRVAVSSPKNLKARLPGEASSDALAAACERVATPCPTAAINLDKGVPERDLSKSPILVISKDKVTLNKEELFSLEALASDPEKSRATAKKALEALAKVFPDESLIVQADKSITAKVLVPLIESANAAGFDDVMFAVNTR